MEAERLGRMKRRGLGGRRQVSEVENVGAARITTPRCRHDPAGKPM